mgnify:CR=1 FL=1
MFHLLRGFGNIILLVLLASCASTEKHSITEDVVSDTGNYKYAAWRLDNTGQFEAINVLLDEADMLIESRAYNSAVDKIERALRIKPEYAPAWSRLSWLALQMDSPERSIQMAKRSNSLAFSDPELQVLNWSFIRAASEVLNDEDSYQRANQKIESLKAFY